MALLRKSGPLLALLVCAALAAQARVSARAAFPPSPEVVFDVPPFPAEVARPFSFGLRSLVADLAFLEAIQVYGGRKGSNPYAEGLLDDRRLARLLTYAVDLDPQFRGGYRFTGNALIRHTSDGKASGVFAAESILERGAKHRPDDWRIFFALGFIRTFYLNKKVEAAADFVAAAALPGAPAYIPLLATRLAADTGNLATAEQLAQAMASQATEEESKKEWTSGCSTSRWSASCAPSRRPRRPSRRGRAACRAPWKSWSRPATCPACRRSRGADATSSTRRARRGRPSASG